MAREFMTASKESVGTRHPRFYMWRDVGNGKYTINKRKTGYIDGFATPLSINYAEDTLRFLPDVGTVLEPDDFSAGYILTNKENKATVDKVIHLYRMITAIDLMRLYKIPVTENLMHLFATDPEACLETIRRFMPSVSNCLEDQYSDTSMEAHHPTPVRHTRPYAAMLDPDVNVRAFLAGFIKTEDCEHTVYSMAKAYERYNDACKNADPEEEHLTNAQLSRGRYIHARFVG